MIPFLNNGTNDYGEKISIERKTGKQTYTGSHFKGAVDHAIDKGAPYAMLIYDTEESLNSGMWRVLQKEISIDVIQEVPMSIGMLFQERAFAHYMSLISQLCKNLI